MSDSSSLSASVGESDVNGLRAPRNPRVEIVFENAEAMEVDAEVVNVNEPILLGAMIDVNVIESQELIPNEEVQLAAAVQETWAEYCTRMKIRRGDAKRRKRWQRQQRTDEERLADLERSRARRRELRQEETAAQRERRLEEARELRRINRDDENDVRREARLESQRIQQALLRENETDEQNEARLNADRLLHADMRDNENDEQREARLNSQRIIQASMREIENDEQREARLESQRVLQASMRGDETDEQREARLEADRLLHANMRDSETDEQRAERNANMLNDYHERRENPPNEFRAEDGDTEMFSLGERNIECTFCGALHYSCEPRSSEGTYDSCCNLGRVKIDFEPNFPEELKNLLKREEGTDWRPFHEKINKYNTSVSFAYTKGEIRQLPGVFHYRTHGEIMHVLPRYTDPLPGQRPAFGQLWIIETNDAIEYRCQAPFAADCEQRIFEFLHNLLANANQYAQIYRMLHEIEDEERLLAEAEGRIPKVCKILFKKTTNNTSDVYALPTVSNEVAGIYICDENGDIPWNDIQVQRKRYSDNEPIMAERISRYSKHMEPLTFVLFNPYGTGDFWHYERPKNPYTNEGGKITPLQYYLYKLAHRPENDNEPFNPILHGGKLLSKYLVWSFSIVDNERMKFLRNNQRKFRVDSYTGLSDYIRNVAEDNNALPGKKIILPSSYTMGPRSQAEFMHDSMAMAQKHGKPNLFITKTCNPDHPDITNELFVNQKAFDRPDVVDIAFNYHVKQFVKEMKSGIFGKVKAFLYVVEFQKRGLPHIHSLWWLEEGWNDPNKIDRFISAEIPDEIEDKELYDLVVKNLLHRPCGEYDPNAMCMQDGRCKRRFPRAFCDETSLDENNYPTYRRRNDGRTATINFKGRPFTVDNRSVVPYNAYLLKRFRCHINVEVVHSLGTVNYLFKYLFKGPSRINIEISNGQVDYDEIQCFLDARYLCAHEACWRLLKFDMHFSSESVERLQVHLPEQQTITLAEDPSLDEMISAQMKKSKLLAFFDLNEKFPVGNNRNLTYVELCHHFTWDAKKNEWHPRCKISKPKCPRMYAVNPKNTELFYLRKLLTIVTGPQGFEDLRRDPYDRERVYDTFREACVARGLVESDQIFYDALEEGTYHNMPRELRRLFARIVAHCDVEAPLWLWNQFRHQLTADLLRSHHGDMDLAEHLAWRQTLRLIINMERSLEDYPILQMIADIVGIEEETIDIAVHRLRGDEMRGNLNPEQAQAFEAIMGRVNTPDNSAACFYVDGPGGSGKTYLFNCIISNLIASGNTVIVMSWSGIAASLYEMGRTVHNVFKLDFPFTDESSSGVTPRDALGEAIKKTKVFIWDETPMAPRRALEAIDEKLREIMNNDLPFGGKVIICGGDFRQLGPVVINGTRNDVIRTSVKSCPLWMHFSSNQFRLFRNERADDSGDGFAEAILAIGNGSSNGPNGKVNLPEECITDGDLVEHVFRDAIASGNNHDLIKRAILSTTNSKVDEYNEKVMDLLDPNTEKVYHAVDRVEENAIEYSSEHFESLKPAGFPAYRLRLRENTVIMLMRNLSIREGLCNGTRLLVKKLERNLIIAERLTNRSDDSDNLVMIPRITLLDDSSVFKVYRTQFPVRPAFAVTINKSQGQTFDQIGIDISDGIFTHGHLYVAVSRTRAWDRLRIKLHPDDVNCSRNIVYGELLEADPVSAMQPDAPTYADLNPNWNANDEQMDVGEEPSDQEDENENIGGLPNVNEDLSGNHEGEIFDEWNDHQDFNDVDPDLYPSWNQNVQMDVDQRPTNEGDDENSDSLRKYQTTDGFSEAEVYVILDAMCYLLHQAGAFIHISAPGVIFGDTNVQFADLLRYNDKVDEPPKTYIFLGNYCDRGRKSN